MAFPMMLALLVVGALQKKTPSPSDEPFQIVDNSFIVEEAFNQEPGVVQNIVGMTREDENWAISFTQEWPAPGIRHQLSYTLLVGSNGADTSFGDVLVNYRLQVLEEGPGRPAFAPRLSLIVPSGNSITGGGKPGLQANLPFSKQHHDFYFHWNAGITWLPRSEAADLAIPSFAGSVIYRFRPMVNLMLESLATLPQVEADDGRILHQKSFTLSPGVRGGWDVGKDAQVIVGVAVPTTRVNGATSTGVFGYFSYELPFKK